MTQRAVEQALGRLVTDERFRRAFASDPAAACRAAGSELSPREVSALAALPPSAVDRLVAGLDDRIKHLAIPSHLDLETRS